MAKRYYAKIKPWDKKVEVARGDNALKVLTAQHLYIDSVCGGVGKCGKCKVQIKGEFKTKDIGILTKEETAQGYCLACQTQILGNVEISVPIESRLGEPQILTRSEAVEVEHLAPRVDKFGLELPAPTLTDNLSDLERLQRALRGRAQGHSISIDLDVLRKLGGVLRAGKWSVTATLTELEEGFEITNVEPGDTTDRKFGLAVDIGTTTVVASLIDLNGGKLLDTASSYNRQIICGADVITRIDYAEEEKDGLKTINSLVIDTMNSLIKELSRRNKVDPEEVSQVVTAGNTIMTHLLLAIPPGPIKREPYIPTANLMHPFKARVLGIRADNAYLYCVPGKSAYVGGDITADILASGLHRGDRLSMLIDVGTNGEVVLGSSEYLMACSCSAGPAFEGGEVDCGSRAVKGAIEKLHITPDFGVEYSVIGNARPIGICGSGLIDLLGELFRCGIVDRSGRIMDLGIDRIRKGNEGKEFVVAYTKNTKLGKDLVITEADIRNIIRTKAAIYASSSLLLKTLNYTIDDLHRIFIAGAFGNYLDAKKATLTGILPDVPPEKLKFIGNGALTGAQLVLLSKEKKAEAEDIFRKITYIDLSTNPKFFEEFTSALFLPHTDMELFPSVKRVLQRSDSADRTP